MAEAAIKSIQEEINSLKSDVDFLKRQLTNFEVMSPEEEAKIEVFLEENKRGKTSTIEELKNELGM